MINTKPHPLGSSPVFLNLAALVLGIVTLVVEFATSRLVANVYSLSYIVWAGVIGMTLFYLMVGYWIGGRWADRSGSLVSCARLMAYTALSVAPLPVIARPLLYMAANAMQKLDLAVPFAISFAIAILFAVPVTLLGCIPSFLIRLSVERVDTAGRSSGQIYAFSTAGGLLGAFGTVLWLIPHLGTPQAFVIGASALMAVGLVGLVIGQGRRALTHLWMPALLGVFLILSFQRPLKPAPPGSKLLFEAETPYNYIQVVQVENTRTRYLLLNEGAAIHSVYDPDQLTAYGSWDYFVAAPYFNAPPYGPDHVHKVALVGLGAGTVARQFTAVYGAIPIDGIEIDPVIVDVGRRYFDMNEPNLNVIVQDARFAMRRLGNDYQVIGIDAYRPPYIPWQLTTVEFFTELQSHLTGDGVVMINVGRTETDRRLVEALTATMLQVFPTVHTLDVPLSYNTMLVATQQPTTADNLVANLLWLEMGEKPAHPFLKYALDLAHQSQRPTKASSLIFTDDRAAVELISDNLVLQAALEGNGNLAPALPLQPPPEGDP